MHGDLKLRPAEIRQLTFPEALLVLDADLEKKRPPPGSVDISNPVAREAHLRRQREMTPAQRLQAERGR